MNVLEITEVEYCLYARKSSEQDERQAMSIDSQLKEMLALAEREGLKITMIKKESHSAKQSSQRPVFNELLQDIISGKVNGILTWAPDRLSRNAGDLGALVDLMDNNKLQQIRTFGQSFSNTPNEKFLLMILCSQAKLENDNRGINVKRGIRARCEMGVRPCRAPLGYANFSLDGQKRIVLDPERSAFLIEVFERAAKGQSGRQIKRWLDASGFRTRNDKLITLSQVYIILKNPFYYGEFNFGSGLLYKGNHEPLITKELFDAVQLQLAVPAKGKWGAKQFPFRRFLQCASCGSTIVGEEKFKQLKDGNKRRHVYYHCSRQVKYDCAEPFVRHNVLVEGLVAMADIFKFDEACIEPGLAKAVDNFRSIASTVNSSFEPKQAFTHYARHILQTGTEFEITRLVRNLDIKLALHDRKVIALQKNSL